MQRRAIKFTVPGPLYAYRRVRDRGAYKPYSRYKARVLAIAMEAGWKARVDSVEEHPVSIAIVIRWRKKPRFDLSNGVKGIEDALFSQDRWIQDIRARFEYNTGKPEVAEVLVEYDA